VCEKTRKKEMRGSAAAANGDEEARKNGKVRGKRMIEWK